MATRKSKKPAAKKAASKKRSQKAKPKAAKKAGKGAKKAKSSGRFRVKIRMYRQGLGDCFLITIPRKTGGPFYAVIDCGVILGTADAGKIMNDVVEHLITTTKGRINLLAATHEHWDHISGFGQAKELWTNKKRLKVDQVWLSWAENKKDPLARKLGDERNKMRLALQAAAARMQAAGNVETAEDVNSLMSFFAAAGTTSDALDVVKGLSQNLRYCTPSDKPTKIPGTNVRVYVLGPPPNEKFIKKYNPSKKDPETYHMAMDQFLDVLNPTLEQTDLDSPFDEQFHVPLAVAQQMPFFQRRYWGEDLDSKNSQAWRRIDANWLDSSSALALQLDSATNNTCLVLAFQLGNGDVLLFAADAQVGNWLSWQDLKWKVNGKEVTGPDLLKRTIFYKVGHHGSHNATLREKGLEQMTSLKLAFIPVDHKMAVKKRWNNMPLKSLLKALNDQTKECVVRIDADAPKKLKNVESDKLFHEVRL
jgi:hypothetical protein